MYTHEFTCIINCIYSCVKELRNVVLVIFAISGSSAPLDIHILPLGVQFNLRRITHSNIILITAHLGGAVSVEDGERQFDGGKTLHSG